MDGTRYQKGGDAGSKGVGFQVGLLTMFLLNALQRFKDWRMSTENQRAGKFDDVVLEWAEGAVLLQAKHKKKKKITKEELLSINSKNDDFSLPKYFLSYQEIKNEFKGTNTLIICSNAEVHEKALEFLDSRRISSESVLYCANDDYSFYTLNTKILPHLKQGIEEYLEKNYRNKNIDRSVINDENLNYFLDHLQIFANFPSDNNLENVIEQLLSDMKGCNGLYENIFPLELRSKVTDWFQHKDGIYLTELFAKAIFSELRTEKYWQTLMQYGVVFRHNNFQFPDSKRIHHMVVENGYLLQVIKIHYTLRNRKIKILSINPGDNVEVQRQVVEAFQLKQYTFLVITWPKSTEESVMSEITNKLRETLNTHQSKKIVLVTESGDELNRLFGLSESDLDISSESGMFNDLSDETREKLLNKKNIVFQGRDSSLKELIPIRESGELEKAAELSLQKLIVNEKIIVGSPLMDLNQNLTHLYINRTFKRHMEKITDEEIKILYSEEDIYNVPGKIVLIADTAGMGKTTVLTSLAAVIKEKHPLLWVIKIELNDFSAILKDSLKSERKTINVLELLQSKPNTILTNKLDNFVFGMEKKVVLMLDGVDEISPDYTKLIINLLQQCQEASNFAKVFVTTRPHVVPELQKKLQVASFKLEPFAEENQLYFLTKYWTNCLNLIEDTDKKKCEKYARALVNKMSLTDLNKRVEDHFTAIPLQLRMLAEIFQNSMVSDERVDWEGCKEYIHANKEEPRLPVKMDLVKLYEVFIDKKRDIFIDKENPNGHTAATRALRAQFDECFNFHRDIALNIVVWQGQCHLFSCYGTNEDMEPIALKIGIVHKLGNECNFIHRTLAEYFVAQSMVRELQEQNKHLRFQKLLIEEVICSNTLDTVLMFFDNFLQEVLESIPSTVFQSYQSSISYKLRYAWRYKIDVIHELALKGYVAVVHLLLKCTNFTIIRNKEGCITQFCIDKKIEKHNTLTYLQCMFQQVGLNIEDKYFRTSLHCAANKGHLKMVKFLVEHGANINSINWYYNTPLMEAAQNGHNDVTKYLLEQALGLQTIGVDDAFKVNDSDMAAVLLEIVLGNSGLNIGKTMVPYVAACTGCLSALEACIERGINLDGKFENGETLIIAAARREQLLTIEYLAKKGANINSRNNWGRTALHIIAEEHKAVPTAELLIRLGVDIDITDNVGSTALHIAYNNFSMMRLLLESGSNVNFRDKFGCTALHKSASHCNGNCVQLLMNYGADANIIDERGNTALHSCLDDSHSLETAKFLVENGADITIKNNRGLTAFHEVVSEKREDFIKFFVEVGMDVNTTDNRGLTALHLAIIFGVSSTYEEWEMGTECSILKFLLDQGVNVNTMSDNYGTVLHVAVERHNIHAIKLFIEAGADVNAKNKEGRTPLHKATRLGKEEVVKFLIEQGADIESRDNKGRTPYVLAKNEGQLHLLQYLQQKDTKMKSS